jgi:hypothetical protein
LEVAADPDQLNTYQAAVRSALKVMTAENLEKLIDKVEAKDLTMDEVSHKLCLIRRSDPHKVNSDFLVTPITDY